MSIEPGTVCPECARRVPHPRKADSPTSVVKSFRYPADDETFAEDLSHAALIVGITSAHKYPFHKFLRFVTDLIFRDEVEWAGAYLSEYEGEGG